jgi:hypothetical protein
MGAPAREVGADPANDLLVEIEAEIVAGREVGQPVISDPQHSALDLVHHRVDHRVLGDQPGQVGVVGR